METKPVFDETRTDLTKGKVTKSSSNGSAYKTIDGAPASILLRAPLPEMTASPFGQVYLTKRGRPMPADAIQLVTQMWVNDYGLKAARVGSTTTQPGDFASVALFYTDAYGYYRNMAKASLKYKHTPTSISTYTSFQYTLDLMFTVVANLTAYLNCEKLIQYNQAFVTMTPNLMTGGRISRAKRLWARAATIFMPSFVKVEALRAGMIAYWPGFAPHLRLFGFQDSTWPYGGAADYNSTGTWTGAPDTIFLNTTTLDAFLDNIEKALWALEGNVTYNAAIATDLLAIKDLFEMLQDVIPGLITQGLPDYKSLPGVVLDKSILGDYYLAALCEKVSTGTAAGVAFPVLSDTVFGSKVPIFTYGKPRPEDFTLLGRSKLSVVNNTAGLRYSAYTNPLAEYGQIRKMAPDGTRTSIFTREDGFVAATATGDLNDGSAIRTFLNSGMPLTRHAFKLALWSSLLTTNFEDRFIDAIEDVDQVWVDEEDLVPNTLQLLGQYLGIPYLR